MPRGIVALDDKVAYLRERLAREGFEVIGLAEGWKRADAVIISGMNENMTGAQDIKTTAPVISAAGRSPEEVVAAVKARLA